MMVSGALLWLAAGNGMPLRRWVIVLGVIALSLVPAVNRVLAAALDRIRHPSQRTAEWAGVLIGVAAAVTSSPPLSTRAGTVPKTEDDCSYVIGTQMLARGHLWMPQHPLADFFESFYLTVKPVYCSIYFPGTALMFAPMVWFKLATWILPVVVCGASVGSCIGS